MDAPTDETSTDASGARRSGGHRAPDATPLGAERTHVVHPVDRRRAGHAVPETTVRLSDLADTITDDVVELLYVVRQDLAESGAGTVGGTDDSRHHLARATALLRDVADDLRTIATARCGAPR